MFNFNVGRLTLQNCSYNAPKTDCKASELQSDGCIEWTQTKNHTNDLQTILCLLNGEWRTNTVMGSIFGCLYTMCMCLHSCKTDCLPLMWWRGKAMTEQQAENKIIKCCFSKHLSVISEHQTGNCTNGTAVKQTSHAICSSSPLSLSTVTPVCCLWGGWRTPAGKILIFISTLKCGRRDRPLHWCPTGDQMKASASPHSSAYASMKAQSRGSPQLIAFKTDEVMVLGLGPPGSPARTSLLDWYIRSRSHMTCHCREQWDGGECFSLLQKWSS